VRHGQQDCKSVDEECLGVPKSMRQRPTHGGARKDKSWESGAGQTPSMFGGRDWTRGPNPTNEIEKNGYQAVCSVDENS
jgi:hypothetical protein